MGSDHFPWPRSDVCARTGGSRRTSSVTRPAARFYHSYANGWNDNRCDYVTGHWSDAATHAPRPRPARPRARAHHHIIGPKRSSAPRDRARPRSTTAARRCAGNITYKHADDYVEELVAYKAARIDREIGGLVSIIWSVLRTDPRRDLLMRASTSTASSRMTRSGRRTLCRPPHPALCNSSDSRRASSRSRATATTTSPRCA